MCPRPCFGKGGGRRRPRGFSLVTAVFLIVVLALLGSCIVTVVTLQQQSQMSDIAGNHAYQAARAGIEWAAHQTLDPNHTLNAASCAVPAMPACPGGGTTHLAAGTLAGSLGGFTVTVTCERTQSTEGNRSIWVYSIESTACNQPNGGSCLGTTPQAGYVERRITATFSTCKDATAAPPRCACA